MYDADELREQLTTEEIEELLIKLGAEDIIDNSDENGNIITNTICHNEHGGSHKLYYMTERHYFHCFTECEGLSIYDIVINRHNMKGISMSFPEAIQWVATETGRAFDIGQGNNSILRKRDNEELEWLNRFSLKEEPKIPELNFHSETLLQVFSNHMGHPSFTGDNINEEAMDIFGIRYDWDGNALIIPHRYYKNGKLVGAMSRNLTKEVVESGFKYVPTKIQDIRLNFPKHLNLYGLWENKDNIKRERRVAIFESEKSVLQFESYFGRENNIAVALGGKNLGREQLNILLELEVEEVILNFDKDYENIYDPEAKAFAEHNLKTARRLTPYMRVFVVVDNFNLLDKKDSPSDKGKEVLLELFEHKKEIFNKG